MKKIFLSFLFQFSVYTLIIWIISYLIYQFLPSVSIDHLFTAILLFLYITALFTYYFTAQSLRKKISSFANRYMLINFGRLVLFTVVIFVYAWHHHNDAAPFAITFFIYYILLTTWEVISLRKITK